MQVLFAGTENPPQLRKDIKRTEGCIEDFRKDNPNGHGSPTSLSYTQNPLPKSNSRGDSLLS